MSSLNNTREISILDESAAVQDAADDTPRVDDETVADYLVRVGTPAEREASIFAGVKRPRRRKPTFSFPRVPSLF